MFKGIDHIEIVTEQMERTVEFYTGVLGFTVGARERVPRSGMGVPMDIVYLELNGTMIELIRYDGATPQDDRDRHLRGFNSPFAPLVLIASSVGQEGIDLQCYCRHVIHYDLEWNPAKLEQREGRVDRHGRLSKGPVNVYFLLCRGTYDERIMHAMVNRFRWHHVLLANRRKLETAPGGQPEAYAEPKWFKQVALDLRPQSR